MDLQTVYLETVHAHPKMRPQIAIALGDPAGIGPEVVLKSWSTLAAASDRNMTCDVTLVGNRSLLQQTYNRLSPLLPVGSLANPETLPMIDVPLELALLDRIKLGEGNAASGAASWRFLTTAIDHTLAGKFHGIVTAPIAKSAWKAAGHLYPGQTELLAEKAQVDRFGMLFVARSPHTGWTLRTLLATTHIPLSQVPAVLTPDLMTLKLDLLMDCLQQDFGIQQPKIAIAGLNPHSGEQGQLGREEQDWLFDWLQQMGDRFPQAQFEGLLPPDTMWVRPGQAWFGLRSSDATKPAPERLPEAFLSKIPDACLALYHDQGLIPVKLMAFDRAVNTTIGLPFVRTSPDHGTAFDIAQRAIADPTSFKAAFAFAIELVQQRQNREKIASSRSIP